MADETVVANTGAGLEGETLLISGGALGTPATGDLQNCTGYPAAAISGVLPAANGGAGTLSGILKANGAGTVSAALAGTDYVSPGAITTSGLTQATARLLGRTTAGTGAIEAIVVSTGLSLVAGTLTASGTGGTVTVSGSPSTGDIAKFAGATSITNATATGSGSVVLATGPTLTLPNATGLPLATGVTGVLPAANGGAGAVSGLLKANGAGTVAAAVAGTDYADAAFKTIAVSGQSDVVADSAADTLTLIASTNMTITTSAGGDSITFAAAGGGSSTRQITFGFPTGSLTVSEYVDVYVAYACTITAVTLGGGGATGSVELDIESASYANYPGTFASIVASAPPTISSATKSQDTGLSGWSTSIAAGTWLRVSVTSVTTLTRLSGALTVTT